MQVEQEIDARKRLTIAAADHAIMTRWMVLHVQTILLQHLLKSSHVDALRIKEVSIVIVLPSLMVFKNSHTKNFYM